MNQFPESVSAADKKVLEDISKLVEILRHRSKEDPIALIDGITLLATLRKEIYEELNQIQHESLAVRAVEWLRGNGHGTTELKWFWNPRQTGDAEEPDISAVLNNKIILSAEASPTQQEAPTSN